MIFTKTSALRNGQFKCFQCRKVVNSKDGSWYQQVDQQVFVCKNCKHELGTAV
jgi:hypothetical protein